MEEEDILLDNNTRNKIINILKNTSFENINIHGHYFNKFGKPRHNISLEKVKEIYYQFDKIIAVTKRKSLLGFKYCFTYRMSENTSYKLMFFLDEKPIQLFNALSFGKNAEKRLIKKFFGFNW